MEASDGVYECKARGIFRKKGISPCCGDKVEFTAENNGYGLIENILPRSSEIIRPPLANLDVLVFVSSVCEPKPNLFLLDQFIAVAEYKGIVPAVVFTKIDKQDSSALAGIYRKAGIEVFEVNNITSEGSAGLKAFLEGKMSAFTGNTGVGKSSLMNCIFPDLKLATNEISDKLGRGKHTTRHVQLYKLENGISLKMADILPIPPVFHHLILIGMILFIKKNLPIASANSSLLKINAAFPIAAIPKRRAVLLSKQ